jgi:hypothetical protein
MRHSGRWGCPPCSPPAFFAHTSIPYPRWRPDRLWTGGSTYETRLMAVAHCQQSGRVCGLWDPTVPNRFDIADDTKRTSGSGGADQMLPRRHLQGRGRMHLKPVLSFMMAMVGTAALVGCDDTGSTPWQGYATSKRTGETEWWLKRFARTKTVCTTSTIT